MLVMAVYSEALKPNAGFAGVVRNADSADVNRPAHELA